jgi:predicted DNA-binding transcriptional regulator YafY
MSRTQRLLDLVQLLRTYRYAVKAKVLANELEVSVRTIYRDIQTLQAQGAPIEGAPGVGYMLKPGFTLPPLMFSVEEIEALVLGVSWVADRTDRALGKAAKNLAAKVKAVLPKSLRRELEATTLIVGPGPATPKVKDETAALLRRAVRNERKLLIRYADGKGEVSERVIWPFGLGYFESVLLVMAWCESRKDLRNFRADRILEIAEKDESYPGGRGSLLERWRLKEGLDPEDLFI